MYVVSGEAEPNEDYSKCNHQSRIDVNIVS